MSDDTKWWHSGLDSYDNPQIDLLEPGDFDEHLPHGPFETFEEAKRDLLGKATEQVINVNGLVERVKAMRRRR